jgi:hypothetical protein
MIGGGWAFIARASLFFHRPTPHGKFDDASSSSLIDDASIELTEGSPHIYLSASLSIELTDGSPTFEYLELIELTDGSPHTEWSGISFSSVWSPSLLAT